MVNDLRSTLAQNQQKTKVDIKMKDTKNKEKEFNQRKKRRIMVKRSLFFFAILEIVLLAIIIVYYC